ncbi:hypothetical protein ACFYQA_39460 [Streptomyces sp. NPDC005774]|uniref:hypothetical protein n=1 Tax=Streptomyces sp. NPDC005774 TaxID=3364728 RepID=UPI0036B5900A
MPSAMGLLEERERVALARAEELRAELERLQVAVAEAEKAARRAVIAREELVDALSGGPAQVTEAAAGEAVVVGGGAGRKAEVPVWAEGLERSVLPEDYARIVSLVERDGAGGGGGVRARGLRDGLGWQATDAREQAARFRAKRLVERGWLVEAGPGLFRPRPGRSA